MSDSCQSERWVLLATPMPEEYKWLHEEIKLHIVSSVPEVFAKAKRQPSCLIFDDRLMGMNWSQLKANKHRFPIIFITTDPLDGDLMDEETICSLTRPVHQDEVLAALKVAMPINVRFLQRFIHSVIEWIPALGILLLLILLWQGLITQLHIQEYMLPAPLQVGNELRNSPDLWQDALITGGEAAAGLLIGVVFGWLLGILFSYSRLAERSLFPWILSLKVTPIVALAPLVAVWVQNEWWNKVIMAAFVCFFPLVVGTMQGLKSRETEAEWLFQSLNANGWQTFWKLHHPRALPTIWTSIKVAAPLASIGAIVAEFCGANAGIGYVIKMTASHMETVRMVAAIIAAAIVSLGLYFAVSLFEHFLWRKRNRQSGVRSS